MSARPRRSTRRHKDDPTGRNRVGLALAAIPAIWLLLFFVIPLLILVFWSFQAPTVGIKFSSPSLESYELGLGTEGYWKVIGKTVATALAVAVLAVLFAYPVAYVLAVLTSGRRRYVLLVLALLPFLTSYILRIFAWRTLLGREGIFNHVLETIGIVDAPVDFLLFSRAAVIIVLVYVWVPWAALPIFVRLEQLDPSLRQAAADLGAPPRRAFRRVTLPLSLPAVYVAFLFVLIPTLGDFATSAAVGGTGGVMLGNLIQGLLRVLSYPSGAVLSVVLLAIAMSFMIIGARILRPARSK